MNIEQYLRLKEKRARDRNQSERQRKLCFTCWRKASLCLCSSIHPISTQTEIVLLMHPKEAKSQRLGTGRLTHAALLNSKILVDLNFDNNQAYQKLIHDPSRHCVLLYPAYNPEYIDGEALPPSWEKPLLQDKKQLTLFILDATWACAKKMMRLSDSLKGLPKISFQKGYSSRFIIKHQPHENCLSSLESVYYSLKGLEGMALENLKGKEEHLPELLQMLMDFQIKCEQDPDIPSTRGTKPKKSLSIETARIRPKKNRLFFWDVDKSPVGVGPKS